MKTLYLLIEGSETKTNNIAGNQRCGSLSGEKNLGTFER